MRGKKKDEKKDKKEKEFVCVVCGYEKVRFKGDTCWRCNHDESLLADGDMGGQS